MSEAFSRAEEWVKQQLNHGMDLASIQAGFPGFKVGAISVNRVISVDPLLLGYFDEKLTLKITEDVIRAVWRVAKLHGLNVYTASQEIRIVKDGILYGLVRQNGFAAGKPALFADLASMVFGIGGEPLARVPVKDSWLGSLATLISDRKVVETLFTVILVILLPTTLAAASLLITPSIFLPDIGRVAAVLLLLLATIYIAKLYIAENIRTKQTS
jgi:hypothetical protein